MSKKKLLQSSVAFSLLLPFSCGIALPAISFPEKDKPAYAMASTYDGNIDDVEFTFENSATTREQSENFSVSALSRDTSTVSAVEMVVSKVNLNVRSAPSTSASIIGTLKAGESRLFIEKVSDWFKIEYDNKTAYVSASTAYSYIQSVTLSGSYVESLVNLNVRSSPSTSASVVGKLAAGEKAELIQTTGSWHKILFDGKVAYVSASTSYSKIVAGGETTPPSPTPDAGETSKVVIVQTANLNVRSAPSTSASIYGTAKYGESYEHVKSSGSWHEIIYNGKNAYVSANYSTVQTISGGGENGGGSGGDTSNTDVLITSCVNSLNVRSGPTTSSACVGSLDKGDMVAFIDLQNGWYQTVYKGQTAYVSAGEAFTSLAYFSEGSKEVENAIEFGCTLLGTPYVYGATRYLNYDGSLNKYFTGKSFDCSSMVQYIYSKTLGIELGSTSRLQSLDGVEVAVGDIKRGDLLFFTNSERYYNTGINRIGHVAIYLGNNYILHTASDYAVIEEISATRWKYFITARDVISTD